MTESLWEFSTRVYRLESVAAACLALQDERGLDVNLLLFCCWHGRYHGMPDAALLREAFAFSQRWSENTTRPLRQARRWLKQIGCPDPRVPQAACEHLREQVKAVELRAEKLQQEALQDLAARHSRRPRHFRESGNDGREAMDAATRNLAAYLRLAGVEADQFVRQRLQTILAAAADKPDRNAIAAALEANL